VKSSGEVGGFAHGTKKKVELLEKEGIPIKNNRVENLEKYLYRF
jgi:alkylated DNA nucleotide flippase Atl1